MPSLEQVISEWLCRYALVLRDPAGLPTRIDQPTIEAYAEFLRDCKPELLANAMRLCGQRARFFPRPQEIRDAYHQIVEANAAHGWRACDECHGAGFVIGRDGVRACEKCKRSPGTAGN